MVHARSTWHRKPLLLLALLLTAPVLAQSGGALSLPWSTIAGGGGTSSGGTLSLQGTSGQPAAATLSGNTMTLVGGFWGVTTAVGISRLEPSTGSSAVELPTTFTLTWTHPVHWKQLRDLDLRFRDTTPGSDETVLWVRFSEGQDGSGEESGRFSLLDATGTEVGSGSGGENRLLETATAALHLAQSSFTSSVPTAGDVTVRFTVSFKAPAAGRRFTSEVLAREDTGNTQGPDPVGIWIVGPSLLYLPLVMNGR